jgi:hypothetical protein
MPHASHVSLARDHACVRHFCVARSEPLAHPVILRGNGERALKII